MELNPYQQGLALQSAYAMKVRNGLLFDRMARFAKKDDMAPGIASAVLAALLKARS